MCRGEGEECSEPGPTCADVWWPKRARAILETTSSFVCEACVAVPLRLPVSSALMVHGILWAGGPLDFVLRPSGSQARDTVWCEGDVWRVNLSGQEGRRERGPESGGMTEAQTGFVGVERNTRNSIRRIFDEFSQNAFASLFTLLFSSLT